MAGWSVMFLALPFLWLADACVWVSNHIMHVACWLDDMDFEELQKEANKRP